MSVDIIDTTAANVMQFGLCGYKDIKRAGYPEKLGWLQGRFANIIRQELKNGTS